MSTWPQATPCGRAAGLQRASPACPRCAQAAQERWGQAQAHAAAASGLLLVLLVAIGACMESLSIPADCGQHVYILVPDQCQCSAVRPEWHPLFRGKRSFVARCRTPSPAREPAAPSAAPPVVPAPPAPAVEEVKELTAEQLALRATTLVEEYLTNRDAKELLLSLQVCPRKHKLHAAEPLEHVAVLQFPCCAPALTIMLHLFLLSCCSLCLVAELSRNCEFLSAEHAPLPFRSSIVPTLTWHAWWRASSMAALH